MHIVYPNAVYPLTVDGTTTGYVTVDDATALYPGTIVNLWSNTAQLECIITEYNDDGTVGLRATPQGLIDQANRYNFGRTDVSDFKVADGAKIMIEKQIVPIELAGIPRTL